MRQFVQNPFIADQCRAAGVEPAPIGTNIYETYAQCNEDLIVEGVLRAQLLRAGRQMHTIRYIEIGANHPIQTSSTYLLQRLYGAAGVLVEPIPALAANLQRVRPRDTVVNATVTASHAETVDLHVHEKHELSSLSVEHIGRFVGFGGTEKITQTIQVRNLHINQFMQQQGAGPIDYLSVDIEGMDYDVLHAMDPVFQPTIIQCEHEGQFGQFAQLLGERGYGLLAITDVNAIFVRRGAI